MLFSLICKQRARQRQLSRYQSQDYNIVSKILCVACLRMIVDINVPRRVNGHKFLVGPQRPSANLFDSIDCKYLTQTFCEHYQEIKNVYNVFTWH